MADSSVFITDLGAVTAYADAKEHGYTGTREEFGTLLANAGTNLAEANAAKNAAKASENAAKASEDNARISAGAAAVSEGNAAASAKKAQDVSDSLPADYTAMSGDVDTLKNQMQRAYPDDSTIGENPWSSKHIVDMLCPPLKESGNPVVCYPVAGYPLGVKVSWEPVQEGSGDPSPDNIRPITGRNSVTITHSNDVVSNDYNIALPETVYGGTLDVETGVLTVDTDVKQFDGTENWRYFSANNIFYVTTDVAYKLDVFMCSHYKVKVGMSNIEDKMAAISGGAKNWHVVIRDDEYGGNVTLFKTRLSEMKSAGKPLQVSRVREDPYTIQLSPKQIAALSGVNTIYTDADGVVVTGAEDPIKRITDLEDAVASQI